MRKLIVNADDFGFNREVTDGIIECHLAGTVTSTTLMVNMPAAEYAAEQSKAYPDLSVGIHLTLDGSKPVSDPSKVSALIGPDGNFHHYQEVFRLANRYQFPVDQVEREFCAQIERFLSLGIVPSHCDSHHHTADCLQFFPIKLKVLKKYGINKLRTHRGFYRLDKTSPQKFKVLLKMLKTNAVRFPYRTYYELLHIYSRLKGFRAPDVRYDFAKIVSLSPLKFDITGWEKLIVNMGRGVGELVAHPGLWSDDSMDRPEFREQRVAEYNLLLNPECKKICQENNVELISFNEL